MTVTVTTFGCKEYLCHLGKIPGELAILPKILSVAEIQNAVARRYNTNITEMRSARRSQCVSRPRQIAMYLSRNYTAKSLPDIGRFFGGRDHTTVIHALRQIEKLRKLDIELDQDIREIERELGA